MGVPSPGATAETVAVNVTDWPKTVGLSEATSAVVVLAVFTTWDNAEDVLPAKLLEPPYAAVIE